MVSTQWEAAIKRHGSEKAARAAAAAYQREYRKKNGRKTKAHDRARDQDRGLRANLCKRARQRGRKSGLGGDISVKTLYWPTHCPVLGILLDYDTPHGQRTSNNPAAPSLDRHDNSRGYFADNVFIISLRANQIKGNATADELRRVAEYAANGFMVCLAST